MQVAKWGNSLAVRLPTAVVEQMGLKAGDDLEIRSTGWGAVQMQKKMTREEALAGLRSMSLKLPKGYTFTRKDAYPDGEY